MRQGKQNLNGRVSVGFIFAILMIVITVALFVLPNFIREPSTNPKSTCINNLRMIDAATQQWALENNKTNSDTPTWADIGKYLALGGTKIPKCPLGGTYSLGPMSNKPTCSYPGHVLP